MNGKSIIPRMFLVISVLTALTLINASPAQAAWGHDGGWGHDRGGWGHHHYPYGRSVVVLPRHSISIVIGTGSFFYSDGFFYQHRDRDYEVVPAPIGAVVYSIPWGCNRVVIAGFPYYSYEGVYYRRLARGYEVVEPPVDYEPQVAEVHTPSPQSQDAFTVNIPNANGGYTAVTLKRSGQGFVGPQGEYYSEFPKIDQLRAMYAK